MICVYKILSPDKQKCYVGSTKDYNHRIWKHKQPYNGCTSKLLFEEFEIENCEFVILEQCLEEELESKEQWWMDHSYQIVNKNHAIQDIEYRNKYAKEYYIKNKDIMTIKNAEYYKKHKEDIDKYRKANQIKINEQQRLRRQAKKLKNI